MCKDLGNNFNQQNWSEMLKMFEEVLVIHTNGIELCINKWSGTEIIPDIVRVRTEATVRIEVILIDSLELLPGPRHILCDRLVRVRLGLQDHVLVQPVK